MKKWALVWVISAACFCLLLYLSGFCELIQLPIVMGLTRTAKSFLFYSFELFGTQLPAFIIPILAIISLVVYAISTRMVSKNSSTEKKWLINIACFIPLLLMAYVSQDKVYMYPVNLPASDIEYYTAVALNQEKNTICLYNAKYGVAKPVDLKANSAGIQVVDNAIQNHKFMIIFYRKNQLTNTQYIDLITVNGEIQYRARPFVLPDLRNGLIIVMNGRIDVRWPWSTPTPAPTNAPS